MPDLRAYMQLFRLPNVFTAFADVMMGYLVTNAVVDQPAVLWLLMAASGLLYTAGMVLNDVFDYEVDLVERPERPLPSGRISRTWAKWLGYNLLVLGLACGWGAGVFDNQASSGLVATALAAAVWLYDRVLKRTPLGPVGMGACRFLNVLLGMSAMPGTWQERNYIIAGGIGLYIVGVTWFARSEAKRSQRLQLGLALITMLAGMWMLTQVPWLRSSADKFWFLYARDLGDRWYILWGLLALSLVYRAVWALADPAPRQVQAVVKHGIMSLIIFDAVLCFGAQGMFPWAMAIIALMMPMTVLGRWIYST